jgi:hypothetical protein
MRDDHPAWNLLFDTAYLAELALKIRHLCSQGIDGVVAVALHTEEFAQKIPHAHRVCWSPDMLLLRIDLFHCSKSKKRQVECAHQLRILSGMHLLPVRALEQNIVQKAGTRKLERKGRAMPGLGIGCGVSRWASHCKRTSLDKAHTLAVFED